MLDWKPRRLVGVAIGVLIIAGLLLMDVLLVSYLNSRSVDFLSFLLGLLVVLSVPALAVLSYLVYGLATLRYLVGRDSLVISWSRRRENIPLATIQSLVRLTDGGTRIKRRGFRWPGHCLGWGSDAGGRRLLFYSTGRTADEVLITTRTGSYVISPANPSGFLAALDARRRLGPTQSLEQGRTEAGLVGLPIWHDWVALGLTGAAALANGSLFAYLSLRYPYLPEIVPLLSEAGEVHLLGTKAELYELPVIGLTVLVVNTALGFVLHRWERPATYALGAVAVLVQGLVWMAVLGLTG
jgi:hypothetical protein